MMHLLQLPIENCSALITWKPRVHTLCKVKEETVSFFLLSEGQSCSSSLRQGHLLLSTFWDFILIIFKWSLLYEWVISRRLPCWKGWKVWFISNTLIIDFSVSEPSQISKEGYISPFNDTASQSTSWLLWKDIFPLPSLFSLFNVDHSFYNFLYNTVLISASDWVTDFSDSLISYVVFQESVSSATSQCMEPARPVRPWGASTTTPALPAAPVVSTNTPDLSTTFTPVKTFSLSLLGLFTCKAHVTPLTNWLPKTI